VRTIHDNDRHHGTKCGKKRADRNVSPWAEVKLCIFSNATDPTVEVTNHSMTRTHVHQPASPLPASCRLIRHTLCSTDACCPYLVCCPLAAMSVATMLCPSSLHPHKCAFLAHRGSLDKGHLKSTFHLLHDLAAHT